MTASSVNAPAASILFAFNLVTSVFQVVRDVLSQVGDKFSLQDVMPSWTNRGRDLGGDFPIGKRCIRASPTADNTIGFFVALFARQDK